MASYDLKAILGEKLRRLTDKTLKALVDCMCTVGASLCILDKRVSALESAELPEGGYKPMQEPVASPSASGTAVQFIDSINSFACYSAVSHYNSFSIVVSVGCILNTRIHKFFHIILLRASGISHSY